MIYDSYDNYITGNSSALRIACKLNNRVDSSLVPFLPLDDVSSPSDILSKFQSLLSIQQLSTICDILWLYA
jgi:hypothetical protein